MEHVWECERIMRRARNRVPAILGGSGRRYHLVTVALVVMAGCSGPLLEFSASPATIPEGDLEARGYVHGNTSEVPLTYPVGMFGLSRGVTVNTWVSGHSKTTEDNETAVLVLYSTPNVAVAGTSVNPLLQLSNRELVRFVLNRTTDFRALGGVTEMGGLREAGSRNITMLGDRTRLASYGGFAEVEGERAEVLVNIAVVEHDGDVVVGFGIHPVALDERDEQAALLSSTEHSA